MDTGELLRRVFDPARFLHDPRRYRPYVEISESGGIQVRFEDSLGVLSFTTAAFPQGDLWRAEAAFEAHARPVIAALRAFEKRHGVPIPSRFQRTWDPSSSEAGAVEAQLVDMIRKTVENMHMVHTVHPEDLPPFPIEYLESAGHTEAAGATPSELWRNRLAIYFPGGPPILNKNDCRRFLRHLMTDESLIAERQTILDDLARAFRRTEWPEDDWIRDASGKRLRPPSLPLYLVRLTNIRWMNDTAEVHAKLRKTGRESSFGTFVRLLAGLPEEDSVYAAALLVDWLFIHLNFYPVRGLGHRSDRIDFITNRLLFEQILLPWLERHGPAVTIQRLAAEDSARSRLILAALRNGFLQETLAGPTESITGSRGLLSVGARMATPKANSSDSVPIATLSPIDLFPEALPDLLSPLIVRNTRLREAFHYGLARSIVDAGEYFSEELLKKNLAALESACRAASPEFASTVPWPEIEAETLEAARRVPVTPAAWSELTERDRAYVTPAEISQAGLLRLGVDWRMRLARDE
jgi:hypothetical protein